MPIYYRQKRISIPFRHIDMRARVPSPSPTRLCLLLMMTDARALVRDAVAVVDRLRRRCALCVVPSN